MTDVARLFRQRIVAVARGFDGVAYRHQGADRHGCDCLGLVRAVWRELYGFDAEAPPAYGPAWADPSGVETLLNAASRHLQPRPIAAMAAGDVLVFRWRPGLAAKHCGILTADDRMIHAYESAGRVAEGHIADAWRRRIAGVFSFPAPIHCKATTPAEGRGSDRCPPDFSGAPTEGQRAKRAIRPVSEN
ncbi:NlpC/P60 family protein [Nitratireductor soli]|uniref:NlpC/P60 family protein n=1 Tax=Nitratireductor soli TaxID=1670619 RepID=UPI0009E46637